VKNRKPKIYAFIDSQNLNLAIRSLGWELDFNRFLIYLQAKYHVQKAFLFIGHISSHKYLYKKLRSYGYYLIFKPTIYSTAQKPKGNIDAELVLHSAAIEFENYDKAIVVSNDGDFYCLIKYLLKHNKLLNLMTPSYKYSSLLRIFAPYIVSLPLFRHKVEKKEGHSRGI
jgi:uncharacterized LabA/DUF88 family protein